MRALSFLVVALAACGGKKDEGTAGDPKPVDKVVACRAGQVSQDGACVEVVTAEKIAAVAQQQSRIDELAKLLEQGEVVAAPVELIAGLRELDAWKAFAATNDKAKIADELVLQIDNAVKTLRTFKASLGEVSTRVGNLKGELDKLMIDTGTAKKLEDVRAEISAQVKAAVEPFAAQTQDTLQNAIVPLTAKLEEASALVDIACGTVRLSGGDKAKALCKDAKDAFAKSTTYLADFKERPAKLFDDVSTTLETQLAILVDDQTKQLVDAAQTKVSEALRLPPAGSAAAGSAAP